MEYQVSRLKVPGQELAEIIAKNLKIALQKKGHVVRSDSIIQGVFLRSKFEKRSQMKELSIRPKDRIHNVAVILALGGNELASRKRKFFEISGPPEQRIISIKGKGALDNRIADRKWYEEKGILSMKFARKLAKNLIEETGR